jgi:ABC-type branched-subunit amino acid transport system permease subunit
MGATLAVVTLLGVVAVAVFMVQLVEIKGSSKYMQGLPKVKFYAMPFF